ncbi:AAA family ATPase [Chloroflexales bacterium ZM16-3]|nr:AAA family ATPase [Chloroflexales bacterium ZM16-3]
MKLDRIVLENFRQYFGKQRLTFARDSQRNVTVIHGVNGAGKTSLFLAINWCLYGQAVDNTKIVENVGELISKELISRSQPGDRVMTAVELHFLHDGERYMARRTLRGSRERSGGVLLDPKDNFTLMRTRGDGQTETIKNPILTINSMLPPNVRMYFLFDGEKIDEFAKPESRKDVKNAIYLVLKLEILERAKRHLEGNADEYSRELRKVSSGELARLLDRDEKARAERMRDEERKTELLRTIESARRKIVDIDTALRESQNARELQQQRDRLDQALRERRGELEAQIGQIRDLAVGSYFAIAQPAVDRALQILDEKRERGEIPSSIRQQFVQDLIAQMRCICGRPIDDGSPEHQRLLNLIQHSLPGSLEDDVLNTSAKLLPFAERVTRQRQDIDAAMRQRTELIGAINQLDAELGDIRHQLEKSPVAEISRLERQRQDFSADVDTANLEIGSINGNLEKLTKEIAQLEKDIARAKTEEQKANLLQTKIDLARRSANAIGEMYERFADDMRLKIEAKTKEIFKLLAWKGEHFEDVRLGEDYHLEVIDRYGTAARPDLSAGERQVLSLSFITAMSRVSEEEAPLVMDTPFGRLSSQHRNNITQHLPALADQLVLFVTDEELRDQARSNLEPLIGFEYRLNFDPRTSCTTIEEEAV